MYLGLLYTLGVISLFRILYYAIGEPSSESPNPLSILYLYTRFLVNRTLRKYGINNVYIAGNTLVENKLMRIDADLLDLQNAKKLMGVYNALGFCPICTFWWFGIFAILLPLIFYFNLPILASVSIYFISNLLNKIIIKWT